MVQDPLDPPQEETAGLDLGPRTLARRLSQSRLLNSGTLCHLVSESAVHLLVLNSAQTNERETVSQSLVARRHDNGDDGCECLCVCLIVCAHACLCVCANGYVAVYIHVGNQDVWAQKIKLKCFTFSTFLYCFAEDIKIVLDLVIFF